MLGIGSGAAPSPLAWPRHRSPPVSRAATAERRPALEIYAQSFDTVEINATFYRLPNVKTVEGWAARTPDDFVFAVKASRYLTHVKRLSGIVEGIKRMDACVDPLRLASKLGPMLWQLPPHFQRNDNVLASALDALTPGRHAFEFRDPSWFAEEVYELLSGHGAALVVADRAPAGASPLVETAPWTSFDSTTVADVRAPTRLVSFARGQIA